MTNALSDAGVRAVTDAAFEAFRQGLGGDQAAIDRFVALLAPDVTMHFPRNLSKTQPLYHGHDGARAVFQSVFDRVPNGLEVIPVFVMQGGNRVAYQFADRGQVHDGSTYRNGMTFTIEVGPDSLITRTWEYIGGPHYFTQDGADP